MASIKGCYFTVTGHTKNSGLVGIFFQRRKPKRGDHFRLLIDTSTGMMFATFFRGGMKTKGRLLSHKIVCALHARALSEGVLKKYDVA